MQPIIILLFLTLCSLVYLIAKTHAIIRAEQLKHISESKPLRHFMLRRFPLLFIPILVVLPAIACGISELVNPTSSKVALFILVFGTYIALQEGNSFRDRAHMLMARK